MAKEVFGIDLGTTYSCIAEINSVDKLPKVLKNYEGLDTTPSVVFFNDLDEPMVGQQAKQSMVAEPARAVAFIKREMPNKSYSRRIGNIEITPVKISAMILKKLIDDANINREYRGKSPIHEAVISVPAYFNDYARKLTLQAAEAAGIKVLGIVDEPVAAALSYGANRKEGKTFMIYDLGGGTFDVSIVRTNNGQMVELSKDGNHQLGGVDWDIALVNYVLRTLLGSNDTYESIKDTPDGGSLITSAEQCKKGLSKAESYPIRFRYKGRMYNKEIKRTVFEELTSELLQKTIDVVHHAIKISKEPNSKIDEIILVGGSSYMPMVKRRLQKEFPGVEIRLDQFEPDLAVAKGAAIYAYNKANPASDPAGKVKLTEEISTHSYGIGAVEGSTGKNIVWNIILRTDPKVYSGSSKLYTHEEGYTWVVIAVYENVSTERKASLEESTLIAKQNLKWDHPVPQGTPIDYTIKRNSDGIIHLELECEGKKIFFEIKPSGGLSDSEMRSLKDDLKGMVL